jgi:hypothetical protein
MAGVDAGIEASKHDAASVRGIEILIKPQSNARSRDDHQYHIPQRPGGCQP